MALAVQPLVLGEGRTESLIRSPCSIHPKNQCYFTLFKPQSWHHLEIKQGLSSLANKLQSLNSFAHSNFKVSLPVPKYQIHEWVRQRDAKGTPRRNGYHWSRKQRHFESTQGSFIYFPAFPLESLSVSTLKHLAFSFLPKFSINASSGKPSLTPWWREPLPTPCTFPSLHLSRL